MRIEIGDRVTSLDGEELGRIHALILDPETSRAVAAVVESGLLIKRAVELPVEMLRGESAGAQTASVSAEAFAQLPEHDPARYSQEPPSGGLAVGYPAGGAIYPLPGAYPGGYNIPALPVVALPVAQPAAAADAEPPPERETRVEVVPGTPVYSSDGANVGEVDTVSVDEATGQIESILVRRGWLFQRDVELPGRVVQSVAEDAVYLNVEQSQVEGLGRERTVSVF